LDLQRRHILLTLPLVLPQWALADVPALPTAPLKIDGAVRNRLALAPEALRQSALAVALDPIALTNRAGTVHRMLEGYRGVKITSLLDEAQIDAANHNDLKRSYVLARARDGYTVVFSWSELYNTPVGPGAFVLMEKDGAGLPDTEGPLALISARDLKTGPRHVRWLTALEVRRV
jgi:hypothetical protein